MAKSKPRPKAKAKPAAAKPKPKPKLKLKLKSPRSRPASAKQTKGKPLTSGRTTNPSLRRASTTKPRGRPAAARTPATSRPAPRPKPKPKRRPKFDAKTLRGIKEKLLTQRDELDQQLKDIEEAAFNATQSEMSGEVGYDEDYADAGSATFEREKDLSIVNNVLDMLGKVNKALEKIDEGSYGVCENCGEPIELARLKALPNALLCLKCKRSEERR